VEASGDRGGFGGGLPYNAGAGGADQTFAGGAWDAHAIGAFGVRIFGADGFALSELRDDDELGLVCEGEPGGQRVCAADGDGFGAGGGLVRLGGVLRSDYGEAGLSTAACRAGPILLCAAGVIWDHGVGMEDLYSPGGDGWVALKQ